MDQEENFNLHSRFNRVYALTQPQLLTIPANCYTLLLTAGGFL